MTLADVRDKLLNLLFPKRCPWCDKVLGLTADCGCEVPVEKLRLPDTALNLKAEGRAHAALTQAWACYEYDLPVSGAVVRMKFEPDAAPAEDLGNLLAAKYQASHMEGRFDIVTPVPVSSKTKRRRGFNQSGLLAQQLAKKTGLRLEEDALEKVLENKKQVSLTREERLKNVKGAYRANAEKVAGLRILLIDDVITTGSTLNECAQTLLDAGAESVSALCLAAAGRHQMTKV